MTTTNKSLEQPASNSSAWDVPLNANFGVIDASLGSTTSINVTSVGGAPVTLTATQYQSLIVKFSGTLSNNVRYNLPSGVGGQWTVYNNTSGAYSVTFGSLGGGTTIAITQGAKAILTCDGTNVFYADDSRTSAGGSNTQVQYNNSGAFAGSANLTFDGSSLSAGNYFIASGVNASTFGYADTSANIYVYNNTGSAGTTNTVSINCNGINRAKFDSSGSIYFNGNVVTTGDFNVGANGVVVNTKFSMTHDGSNAALSNTTGSTLFYSPSSYVWHISGTQLARLDVNGNFDVGSGDQSGSGLYNCISTLGYFTRSGYSGSFDGNVFNISWSGSAATLWIGNGNAGIINTTSDRRIKEKITSLPDGAVAQIMALRSVTYTHKSIGIWRPDGEKVGFVADEVAKSIPQAVIGEPDAFDKDGNIIAQNIDPIAILSVAVKAFQELKSEFDAYKAAHP